MPQKRCLFFENDNTFLFEHILKKILILDRAKANVMRDYTKQQINL